MTISPDSEVMAYAVYADDDGRLTFSTCSTLTTFDTKIMVFRDADDGGDVAQGVLNRGCLDLCMGSNDDDYSCGPNTLASTVTVDVQGGETYIVLVSGYASYSYGSFELSISWAKGLTTGTVAAIVIPLGACACCMLLRTLCLECVWACGHVCASLCRRVCVLVRCGWRTPRFSPLLLM